MIRAIVLKAEVMMSLCIPACLKMSLTKENLRDFVHIFLGNVPGKKLLAEQFKVIDKDKKHACLLKRKNILLSQKRQHSIKK